MKTELETLKAMYPSATKADIMEGISERNWAAVSKYARHRLGLHRTKSAKGRAMRVGKAEAKQKKEGKK